MINSGSIDMLMCNYVGGEIEQLLPVAPLPTRIA